MTGLTGKLKTLAMVGKWENPNAELLEGEQPVVKFKNKNEIDIGMTAFSFNVSMDDFYVITSISRKIVEEGLELAKIWTDYAVNDVVSDEFKDYKKETAVYPETQVDITADGAELVIINEEKGNFVPLFMTKVEGIKFSMADGVIEDTMEFYGDTGFSVYYFNQNSGYWEPAVEPVLLNAKFQQLKKQSVQKINFHTPINMNASVQFAGCLSEFNRLWAHSSAIAKKRAKKVAAGHTSMMQQSYHIQQKFSKKTSLGEAFGVKQKGIMFADEQLVEKDQDIVSPYAIRNMTDRTIKVYCLTDQENSTESTAYIEIPAGSKKDLAVALSTLESERKSSKNIGQKSQFVRLQFEKPWMKNIERVNLNDCNTFFKHRLVDQNSPEGKKNQHREDYFLINELLDNKRVLTIRTQYTLTNRTQTTYQVRQFYVDKSGPEKRVKTVLQGDVKPGESMPIPDHSNPQIMEQLKISIRPENCRKWSTEYKLFSLKKKLNTDDNILWEHYTTFSVLRKENVRGRDDVVNFILNPAMIVKNCLPIPISMLLSQEEKTEEELKQNNRQGTVALPKGSTNLKKLSTKTEKKRNTTKLISGAGLEVEGDEEGELFDFYKGEEKYINQIRMTTKNVNIVVALSKQFMSQKLQIGIENPDIADLPIKYTDKQGREFHINARIETKTAGLFIIFYAKNVLLCHTVQDLQFFHEKKQGLFEEDNAHEFPSPVLEHQKGSSESDEQSAIFIFDHQPHLCAALSNQPNNKSEVVGIGSPGITGDLIIPVYDNLYEFSCYTGLYQPSTKDLILTKIVEVQPKYVVVNMTTQTIWFSQSCIPIGDVGNCLELNPKDRLPFHWSSKQQERMTHFSIEGAKRACAKFSLSDAGSLNVENRMEDGTKTFFKVTKRNDLNSIFVIIEDMKSPPYLIDNQLPDMQVNICQMGTSNHDDIEKCLENSKIPYAWTNQQGTYMLNVDFIYQENIGLVPVKPQDPNNNKKNRDMLEFSLDTLNATERIHLKSSSGEILKEVYVSVYVDEKSKVIEFTETPSVHIFETHKDRRQVNLEESKDINDTMTITLDENDDPNIEQAQIQMEIPSICMSFINDGSEVFTFSFTKINAHILQKEHELVYEMVVDRMQIDNQSQQEPIFPVVLKPKCTVPADQEHNHFSTPMINVDPILQFYVSMKTNIPNVMYITLFEFLVKELEFKVEVEHMNEMIEYGSAIGRMFGTGITAGHAVFSEQATKKKEAESNLEDSMAFESEQIESTVDMEDKVAMLDMEDDDEEEETQQEVITWRSKGIEADSGIIYIQKYSGSPISIEVSLFKQTRTTAEIQERKREGIKTNNVIQDFGFKLSSITDAPVQLNSLEIENVYGPQNVVQAQLQDHYLSNIRSNLLRLVGSSDLIGNPTDFVNTLGTGVKSFYYEPREGFMKGPLQGGIGLIRGTGSLAAHVVGGIAGSVSKVTNTVNKGLLQLSLDTEYIHKKEIKDIRQKPTGAIDGLAKGFKGLGNSIWGGVSGIVMKPVRGAQRDGASGFVKGVGVGIAGAVVKPVSGVVDLVSKTNEGIESQVDGSACKLNNQKQRRPRAFYKETAIFKEYNYVEAAAYLRLHKTNKRRYQGFASTQDSFYGAFKVGENVSANEVIDSPILMLTKSSIVLFNQTFEVLWYRQQIDLISVELQERRLLVTWRRPPYGKFQGNDEIVPDQLIFASEDRSEHVEATFKEILQVREFDENFQLE